MHFVMDCLDINQKGHLTMGGCDLTEVAREYKTPLYVMDEEKIRENCRTYLGAMKKYYQGNGMVLYASKALSCKGIYRIMKEEGMGIDVVSGGELYTAIQAGFPMENVYFHGNNKTAEELILALENGVGRIVVDNTYELEMLNRLAGERGLCAKILFRIKPGIEAHTHSFVQTGQIDSKFGVALETGEAEAILLQAQTMDHVSVVGVHCHIGSQIFELAPFQAAASKMLSFMASMRREHGMEFSELNLGGGFGSKYVEGDLPISYDRYIEAVSRVVRDECEALSMPCPYIVMEPGRSIVASAGLTLYTVGAVKEIPGVRTYVAVDGGMPDNPRYIMYGAEYSVLLPENPHGEAEQTVTVAGKCCESGDILAENVPLPKVEPGQLLAVLTTGAYNYSMASNYNRIPRPPIVLVKDGKTKMMVRRETYQDVIKCDL